MKHNEETISFLANKKWLANPADMRKKLERNVWCSFCNEVVQIENYVVKESPPDIVLEGSCEKCGKDVTRFIV